MDDFEEIVEVRMTASSPHLSLPSHQLAHQPSAQILAPSNHLQLQSPDLVNQTSIQI